MSDRISSVVRRSNYVQGWVSRARLAPVIMVAGIAAAAWGQHILLSEREFALRGALLMTGGGLAFLTALVVGWQPLDAKAVLDDEEQESAETSIPWGLRQKTGLAIGILGGLAGFFLNSGNTFSAWGSSLWLLGCLSIVLAFWPSHGRAIFRLPKLHLSSAWVLATLASTLALAAFFRFYDLDNIIREMDFDHAENIYDIRRITDGDHPVYFLARGGRAGLFFYLGAGLTPFFGHSFLTIKVLTAIIGVLTVAATYFMTKELFGNRRVALIAAVLISLSFWHIILSRVGLRPIFTPLAVALTLLFLFRALKYNRSSDFVFSGLFLGLGLYAYTAARMVPVAVGLILIISLLNRLLIKRREWPLFLVNAGLLILTALVVFAPLGRYVLDEPSYYWQRTNDVGLGLGELATNAKLTLVMFNWRGPSAGLWNAPDSAQLDYLTGAAFVLGLGAMALFWLRRRRGLYAYAAVALLVMLVPGIAATPIVTQMPSARWTAGVIPLVFAAAALPFYIGSEFLVKAFGRGALVLALPLLGVALALIGFANHHIYFDEYAGFNHRVRNNVSEFGAVFRSFEEAGGDLDNAYLKEMPHFVDLKTLAIEMGNLDWCAGYASCNGLRDVEDAREHALNPEAKMYVVALDDGTSLLRLREIYPRGSTYKCESRRTRQDRDFGFFVLLVPAKGAAPMAPLPDTCLIREGR